jgi:chromosomal replication initiator protein
MQQGQDAPAAMGPAMSAAMGAGHAPYPGMAGMAGGQSYGQAGAQVPGAPNQMAGYPDYPGQSNGAPAGYGGAAGGQTPYSQSQQSAQGRGAAPTGHPLQGNSAAHLPDMGEIDVAQMDPAEASARSYRVPSQQPAAPAGRSRATRCTSARA